MTGIGCTLLETDGKGQNGLTWLEMVGSCWTGLEMDGNGLKGHKIFGNGWNRWNGRKYLKIAGYGLKSWKQLDMTGSGLNGWKLLEMARNGLAWLEMAGIA